MAAVLTTGLNPRPDDRPTDAETLLARLESAIEETHGRRWLAAAGMGAIGSTAATIATGTTLTGTAGAAPEPVRRSRTTAKPGTRTHSREGIRTAAGAGSSPYCPRSYCSGPHRPTRPQHNQHQPRPPPLLQSVVTRKPIGDLWHLPVSLPFLRVPRVG